MTEYLAVERRTAVRLLVWVWLLGIVVGFGLGLVVGDWL